MVRFIVANTRTARSNSLLATSRNQILFVSIKTLLLRVFPPSTCILLGCYNGDTDNLRPLQSSVPTLYLFSELLTGEVTSLAFGGCHSSARARTTPLAAAYQLSHRCTVVALTKVETLPCL